MAGETLCWLRSARLAEIDPLQVLCQSAAMAHLHAHHIEPLSLIINRKRAAFPGNLGDAVQRHAFAMDLLEDPEIVSIENGITLCQNCHREVHRGLYISQERRNPHRPKVSLEQKVEIAELYAMGGVTQKQIGERFGISQAHVSTILRRQGIRIDRGSRYATERF